MMLAAWFDNQAQRISLKNKIFLATVSVVLLLSLIIALFTRWVLISSLTHELKQRGVGIAENLAKNARVHVQRIDLDGLNNLITSAREGESRQLVAYIIVLGRNHAVMAHTFAGKIPNGILDPPPDTAPQPAAVRLLKLPEGSMFDIATPIRTGNEQIGRVHVGLFKNHIDALIGKLRLTFVGFVSAVSLLFFGVSHWLARIITRPLSDLSRVADEIGHGNLGLRAGIQNDRGADRSHPPKKPPPANGRGRHNHLPGDEVVQLARSINSMSQRIKTSENELRASELKYRLLFNSGPNPVFVLNRSTLNILDANPRAEETYGYYREELIGRPFTDLGDSSATMPSGKCSIRPESGTPV